MMTGADWYNYYLNLMAAQQSLYNTYARGLRPGMVIPYQEMEVLPLVWTCRYCGNEWDAGEVKRNCRTCGAPRG